MSKFIGCIKALVPKLKSQKALDDAYLSQAADIHDLELRRVALEVRNLWSSRGLLPC